MRDFFFPHWTVNSCCTILELLTYLVLVTRSYTNTFVFCHFSHHFPRKEDWACLRQGPRPLRDVNGLHLGSESAEVMTTVIRDRCPPKKDSSRPLKVVVSLSLSEFCTVCAFAFLQVAKTFFLRCVVCSLDRSHCELQWLTSWCAASGLSCATNDMISWVTVVEREDFWRADEKLKSRTDGGHLRWSIELGGGC